MSVVIRIDIHGGEDPKPGDRIDWDFTAGEAPYKATASGVVSEIFDAPGAINILPLGSSVLAAFRHRMEDDPQQANSPAEQKVIIDLTLAAHAATNQRVVGNHGAFVLGVVEGALSMHAALIEAGSR